MDRILKKDCGVSWDGTHLYSDDGSHMAVSLEYSTWEKAMTDWKCISVPQQRSLRRLSSLTPDQAARNDV